MNSNILTADEHVLLTLGNDVTKVDTVALNAHNCS